MDTRTEAERRYDAEHDGSLYFEQNTDLIIQVLEADTEESGCVLVCPRICDDRLDKEWLGKKESWRAFALQTSRQQTTA